MNPTDATSRSVPLAPKIVAEVRELHDCAASLARNAGVMRGRRTRRELREAREAESDLLRALGFANYDDFVATIDDAGAPGPSKPELSIVEVEVAAVDAQPTEVDLLRVLRDISRHDQPSDRNSEPNETDTSRTVFEAVHSRVAAFEEELAEARFELLKMRDELRARREPLPRMDEVIGAGVAAETAATALVQAAAELRSLCELLREERGELASLGSRSRAEAEQILEQARVDARLALDEAAADARRMLDRAHADAVALTRDALVTLDGLRRIAGDAATTDDDPTGA